MKRDARDQAASEDILAPTLLSDFIAISMFIGQ